MKKGRMQTFCTPGYGAVLVMGKIRKLAVIICLCAVFLAGCGGVRVPDVVNTPTVAVGREGDITVWQIGDFGKSYYDLAELDSMARKEAAEYNAEKGRETAVSVEKVESLEGGRVAVVYLFDNWESCSGFGEETLFYGEVKEAAVNGFSGADTVMKSVKDDSVLDGGLLGQSYGEYLLVTDMKADIYCGRKVVYISQGASVNEDGSIRPPEEDGFVYILMK